LTIAGALETHREVRLEKDRTMNHNQFNARNAAVTLTLIGASYMATACSATGLVNDDVPGVNSDGLLQSKATRPNPNDKAPPKDNNHDDRGTEKNAKRRHTGHCDGGAGASDGVGGSSGGTNSVGGTAPGGASTGGTAPSVCVGYAPASDLITDFSDAVTDGSNISFGTSPNLGGGIYTYSAQGLNMPTVSLVSNGSGQALAIAATPGTPVDSGNAWLGVGSGLGSCVDASAYAGVQFSIKGDLSSCSLVFSVNFSEDNSVTNDPAFGSCTSSSCYPPASSTIATGPTDATYTVLFADMNNGGSPMTVVDTRAITGLQWQLAAPLDGSCAANFTIDDVRFVQKATTSVSALSVDSSGYVTSGPWSGYSYAYLYNPTGLADSILPGCAGAGCGPSLAAALCASGTLAADATYASSAGLGFNLSQPQSNPDGSAPAPNLVSVSGSGVVVDLANLGGTDVRVQLSDGANYWCYDLGSSSSPATIPWPSFNTACWDNSGSTFDKSSPIESIQLTVPSGATSDTMYDVCLVGLGTF
jgi:hypothetical protein